ncbi:radical SAM/SPASM domain-containing protein [Candidatus Omnitrophota bacterium]
MRFFRRVDITSKIQLAILFLKKRVLTVKRIINFLCVSVSYLLRLKRIWGYPPALMIEPTTYCNLKCPLCPTGNGSLQREKGIMQLSLFKNIIDEFGDKVMHLTLWGYGEPFMAKGIYDMIKYAKAKHIFVRTSTNGHFFSNREDINKLIDSGLDNLIVALDGASQETLSKYRIGANFKEIVKSVKSISEIKKEKRVKLPFVELQFIAMKYNEHEIPLVRRMSKEIGVNKLTIKTVGRNTKEDFITEDDRFKRQVNKNRFCSRLWFSSMINWDGTVMPCCYDFHGKYTFGKLDYPKGQTFENIWNNENYITFRERILKSKRSIEMCRLCHGSFASLNVE